MSGEALRYVDEKRVVERSVLEALAGCLSPSLFHEYEPCHIFNC